MEKFYIIRTDYHNQYCLYAVADTLVKALNLVHNEHLSDAAVEFCRGSFPSDYEVYKTLFSHSCSEGVIS